jgi:hypothetical protein
MMAADTEIRCLDCNEYICDRDFSESEIIARFLTEHLNHDIKAWSEYLDHDSEEESARWDSAKDQTARIESEISHEAD